MTSLVQEYGYASEGETFTIADTEEVWLMEMIGKGSDFGEMGAVWAAVRVPDGMVSAHANQARIRFLADGEEDIMLFAPDVVDFAR
jgi:dipeptidase